MSSTHKLPLNERRLIRANLILRRVYDLIEMSHLTDHKLKDTYCNSVLFKRQLGEDIFNHLNSDPEFLRVVIKRQKRYRQGVKRYYKYLRKMQS